MPKRKSYIAQATVLETLGAPDGYHRLSRLAQHRVRHSAKIAYDVAMGKTGDLRLAANAAIERAAETSGYYVELETLERKEARCGAKAKRTGEPCRMKPIEGRTRCKYHGGRSTGPISLEGRIKALSCLKQYQTCPDLLAARIKALEP